MKKLWIGLDFDGTIAHYDKWRGVTHTGQPILAMVERVKAMLADGHCFTIFTARLSSHGEYETEDRTQAESVIRAWCREHLGQELDVTNLKLGFDQIWDDRAHHVIPNTGQHARSFVFSEIDRLAKTSEIQSLNAEQALMVLAARLSGQWPA